jgi:hypothetical protein
MTRSTILFMLVVAAAASNRNEHQKRIKTVSG